MFLRRSINFFIGWFLLTYSLEILSLPRTITSVHLTIDSKTNFPIAIKGILGGDHIKGRLNGINTNAYMVGMNGREISFTLILGTKDKNCRISFVPTGPKVLTDCDAVFPEFSYELSNKLDEASLYIHFDTPLSFLSSAEKDLL